MTIQKVFMTLFAFCCIASSWADNGENYNSTTVFLNSKKSDKRPNAPSRYLIECHYCNGYIDFTFLPNSNFMTVELMNDEVSVWTELITIENPLIELPSNLSGEYNIVCTTDKDQVFVGTIYL